MLRAEVPVVNRLGLHARAAAQLVKLASSFQSNVTLLRPDTNASANARSILNILTLAAINGTVLEIVAEGEDEAAAIAAIQELFARGFGEE
jgi:phosphocarrier protein HPr